MNSYVKLYVLMFVVQITKEVLCKLYGKAKVLLKPYLLLYVEMKIFKKPPTILVFNEKGL